MSRATAGVIAGIWGGILVGAIDAPAKYLVAAIVGLLLGLFVVPWVERDK